MDTCSAVRSICIMPCRRICLVFTTAYPLSAFPSLSLSTQRQAKRESGIGSLENF